MIETLRFQLPNGEAVELPVTEVTLNLIVKIEESRIMADLAKTFTRKAAESEAAVHEVLSILRGTGPSDSNSDRLN
jgi:hypothetical protein